MTTQGGNVASFVGQSKCFAHLHHSQEIINKGKPCQTTGNQTWSQFLNLLRTLINRSAKWITQKYFTEALQIPHSARLSKIFWASVCSWVCFFQKYMGFILLRLIFPSPLTKLLLYKQCLLNGLYSILVTTFSNTENFTSPSKEIPVHPIQRYWLQSGGLSLHFPVTLILFFSQLTDCGPRSIHNTWSLHNILHCHLFNYHPGLFDVRIGTTCHQSNLGQWVVCQEGVASK